MFDLTKGGPGPAIQMFKHVPDVRLLACGGDGTAGWVLSVLDKVRHTANTDTSTLSTVSRSTSSTRPRWACCLWAPAMTSAGPWAGAGATWTSRSGRYGGDWRGIV